jgi:hypothetical protein
MVTETQFYKGFDFRVVHQPASAGRGHRDPGGYIPYVGTFQLIDRYETEAEAEAAAMAWIDGYVDGEEYKRNMEESTGGSQCES